MKTQKNKKQNKTKQKKSPKETYRKQNKKTKNKKEMRKKQKNLPVQPTPFFQMIFNMYLSVSSSKTLVICYMPFSSKSNYFI